MDPRVRRFYGSLRWPEKTLAILLLLYALASLIPPLRPFSGVALFFFYIFGAIVLFRLARRASRRILWRLRRRLIVAYVFIALVPIFLILVLVGIGVYILTGQAAIFLVNSELDGRTAALRNAALLLAHTPAAERPNALRHIGPVLRKRFPDLELLVRDRGMSRWPAESAVPPPSPEWKEKSGVVVRNGRAYNWAHVTGDDCTVTAMAPLTDERLADLVPRIGDVSLNLLSANAIRDRRDIDFKPAEFRGRHRDRVPPAANRLDFNVTWFCPLSVSLWDSPGRSDDAVLFVHTRPSAVVGTVFGQKVDFSQAILALFLIVAGLFLVVELVSLLIGISLTRTITRAVHSLYQGTMKVQQGDFSHRIEVEGNDQLAELSHSFNSMTENLGRLIVVEKEQQRLQSEIEIAREVQGQLFPKAAPKMKTLEVTGLCHPARMVSGDYYDFVGVKDSGMALAIGDVAGKGISAALLMAAIQSIMRTQLNAPIQLSTASLVAQLSRQLYANTAPEKYATFFFGLYDEENRKLSYTNAGHLPPILVRDGSPEMLEVTGTVVGAFPSALYEERNIGLMPGDLLVGYTDGITEPENAYGEMFGEERLIELLVRNAKLEASGIMARVMEAVRLWTGSSELQDDMTLLLARGL